jgi:hypothetical protein
VFLPKIDVTDEAVIDAPPAEAYKAILDEYAGVTNWFMLILKYNLRGVCQSVRAQLLI